MIEATQSSFTALISSVGTQIPLNRYKPLFAIRSSWMNFLPQTQQVVAKVEHHQGELFTRLRFDRDEP